MENDLWLLVKVILWVMLGIEKVFIIRRKGSFDIFFFSNKFWKGDENKEWNVNEL